MRRIIVVSLVLGLIGCSRQNENIEVLQNRIDSLQNKISDSYKPGFGEFMSYIQAHHAKLWFAGQNHNWELADFEIHEIMEAVEDIQKFETDREESQMIGIINPALDSMVQAIEKQNPELFDKSYITLTNTCNECHHAANFAFNVVKIPDTQTFSNQDFKPQP